MSTEPQAARVDNLLERTGSSAQQPFHSDHGSPEKGLSNGPAGPIAEPAKSLGNSQPTSVSEPTEGLSRQPAATVTGRPALPDKSEVFQLAPAPKGAPAAPPKRIKPVESRVEPPAAEAKPAAVPAAVVEAPEATAKPEATKPEATAKPVSAESGALELPVAEPVVNDSVAPEPAVPEPIVLEAAVAEPKGSASPVFGAGAVQPEPVIVASAAPVQRAEAIPGEPSGAVPGIPLEPVPGTEAAEVEVPYDEFMADYSEPAMRAGDLCQGQIVSIEGENVIVHYGGKTEGIVPLAELRAAGMIEVSPGQDIEVTIESLGGPGDYAVLSFLKAHQSRIWELIEEAFREKAVLTAKVLERVKGGLTADIGVPAFLPGSQADVRPVPDLDALVGQDIPVRIVKLSRSRGNVVVSRRALLEEELQERRQQTLAGLTEGAIVTGTVKNVTNYGAFIDLGGIDGLLHVTDLSWGRVRNPTELVRVA
ncbi:MAG: S1 RNA-binding domain-containing protein, partial [Bryobacterales bacterium]